MGKKSKPQKKKSNHKRGGNTTTNSSNGTSSSSTSNYYGLRNPPFGTSTASSTISATASSSFDNEDEIFTTYSSISQSSSTSFQSLLSIYKTAISKFKDNLMDMMPLNDDDEIFFSSRGNGDDVDVEALLDAVDCICQQQQGQSSSSSNDNSNVVVNNGKEVADGTELLSNLRLAIRIRKKYINNNKGKSGGGGGGGGGGEESQEYFFAILNYCLQVLTSYFGKKKFDTTKVDNKIEEDESTREFPTLRFAALSLLENDDNGHNDNDGRDDEEETKPAPPVRPQNNHTQKKSYTYSDLMELPDKAQCQFLFDTIACHIHRLCKYLQNLKESIRMMQNIDDDDDANNSDERMTSDQILNELTGLYIVSTSMMLDIQNLEQDLYRECPQLGESPYRVIACAFLTPFINLIKDTVKEQSQMLATSKKIKNKYSPEDVAIAYVGDIVECIFRKCRIEETKEITTRFCKRWKLSEHWTSRVCWISELYSRLIFLNVMTKYEEYSQGDSIAKGLKESMGGQKLESLPNNWLEENPFWECISGNRSIFSTMKLLDMFGGSSHATTYGGGESTTTTNTHNKHPFELVYSPLLMANGIWDEETNLATTLRGGCIETLLMQNLLPCIMNSAWSDNGIPVVRETTMLPLAHMIRSWTNHSNQQFKNSFALTFGVHAMLLSILEIQGDGDVTRIGKIAESTYDDFFMQVQDGLNASVPISKARKETLDFILKTRQMTDLPKPTQVQQLDSTPSSSSQNNEDRQRMLFWNPLCASMFLGYAKLCLSLEGGLSAMNLCFETTSVLHLYNALKRCGMVDEDLPLVAEIDRKFSQEKRVWNGLENKPEKGKFLYRWHLSMGADHDDSLYHQEVVKARLLGVDPPPQKGTTTSPSKSNNHRRSSNRVASEIKPEDVSRTFKYFCHHEFAGAENEEVVPDHVVKVNRRRHHHHHPMPESMQQSSTQLYRTIMAFADESDDLLSYNMVAVSSVFQQFLFEVFQNPPAEQQQNVDVSDVAKQMDLLFSSSDDPGDIRALMNFKETERILGNLDYEQNIDEAQKLGKSFQEFFTNLDLNKVRIKPKPPTL